MTIPDLSRGLDPLFAMLAGWSLRAGFVVAIAALAALVLRARSAALRHAVWRAALVAVLALPALGAFAPRWTLPWLPAHPTTATASLAPDALVAANSPARVPAPPAPVVNASRDAFDPRPLLLALWATGALLFVTRLLVAQLRLRGLVRDARPVLAPEWKEALAQAGAWLAPGRPVALLASDRIAVPITCGWRHARIVIPISLLDWNDGSRAAVLRHELAHIQRGDLAWRFAALLTRALLWFHPLVWFAVDRLHRTSEHACDDLALGGGERPSRYAGALLEIAGLAAASRPAPDAALAFLRREGLTRRIDAVLASGGDRRPLARRAALTVAAFAIAGTLLVALPELVPASGDPGRGDDRGTRVSTSERPVRITNPARTPLAIVSATVTERTAARRPGNRVRSGPEVVLAAPRIEVRNRTGQEVNEVLVRFSSAVSRDLMWLDLPVAPLGRAELEVDEREWSQTVTRDDASRFTISIAGVRFSDGDTWLDPSVHAAEDEPDAGRPDAPAPRPEAPSARGSRSSGKTPAPEAMPRELPAPRAGAPAPQAFEIPTPEPSVRGTPSPAPRAGKAPDAPQGGQPAEMPAGGIPAEVRNAPGAPVVIDEAIVARADIREDGTGLPYVQLTNRTGRAVNAVKLRFKCDAPSHAVSVLHVAMGPHATAAFRWDTSLPGRPEDMRVQLLGVRFADGSTWGTLDSWIDARDEWIDIGGSR